MPVGTQASVKAISPRELRELNAPVILSNTYHLAVRPGKDLIAEAGGLHRFMSWDRAILTDSGGYQVFSLAKLRRLTEEGVTFQNHIDGAPCKLTPESVLDLQRTFGSDIAMVLDECPPAGCSEDYARKSLMLTHRWAERAALWLKANPPARDEEGRHPLVFGIVQGSVYPELRKRSADYLTSLDFPGYAIGGVSVGESEPQMMLAVESAVPYLPEEKPRYTMGLGTPRQMVEMVARGVDLFDCVLPTRVARNGTAYIPGGTLHIRNAAFLDDFRPVQEGCLCPACQEFSRAYIRHLVKADEILGLRLLTLHNLHFYLSLMREARGHILNGTFGRFYREQIELAGLSCSG